MAHQYVYGGGAMKIIMKLCDMIEEEIADAHKYIECALEKKEEDKSLADMFYKLSLGEIEHMNMLHKQAVEKIDAARKEKTPPAYMLEFYNYLHKKHIEKAKEVKILQAMYES